MNHSFARAALLLLFVSSAPLHAEVDGPGPSGSLLVRVYSGDERLPIAGAGLEAIELQSLETSTGMKPRPPVVLGRATSDEKGWATIDGLPAAELVLRVVLPGRKQPHVSEPISIGEGERLVIDELSVPPPAELIVHLDMSESVREHLRAGRVRAINVWGRSSAPGVAGLKVETSDPTATFSEVPPGKWMIRGSMIIGRTQYVLDPPRGLEVEVPPGTRIDFTLPVEALLFAGRVTYRDEPFVGQMNLMPSEPKPGNWGFAVPFDEEGRFIFPLPAAGEWDLKFHSRTLMMHTALPRYEFRERDAGREIEIELPEGEIAGKVIEADGNAAGRVHVSVDAGEKRSRFRAAAASDEDGQFVLKGLTGGRWTVLASNDRASSEPLVVTLSPDGRMDGVVLRLDRPKRQIRVVGPDGVPIAGASLIASALVADHPIPASTFGSTDAQGREGVELRVQDGVPIAIAVIQGRDELRTFLVPAADEMTVTVPPADAAIRFVGRDYRDSRTLVHQDGSFFRIHDWIVRFGPRGDDDPPPVRVRSGTWQLVVADTPEALRQLYLGLGFSLPAEQRFHLEAGKTIDIE